VDAEGAREALTEMGLDTEELIVTELKSPAQVEKVLKKHKLELPKDLVVAISSGQTIAPESDPRPAVLTIGKDIRSAFSKLEVK
jgi:short-subunit dehydrogenase involved in D-alanine esterification of teichoic acids